MTNELLSRTHGVLRLWVVACVVCYSWAVSQVTAIPPVTSISSQGVVVYVANFSDEAAPFEAAANGMATAADRFNLQAVQISAALNGLNSSVGGLANVNASMAQSLNNIALSSYSLQQNLPAILSSLSQSATRLNTINTTMTTGMQAWNTSLANLNSLIWAQNATVGNAINAAGAQSAQIIQTNLSSKLQAILNVLLTNGVSTNPSNSIPTLVGPLTNTLPDWLMSKWADYLDWQTGVEDDLPAVPDSATQASEALVDADNSAPHIISEMTGYQPVTVPGGFTTDFMKIRLTKPPGAQGDDAAWTIDLNPMTFHDGVLASSFSWFRRALAWGLTIMFLWKVSKIAQELYGELGKAQQARIPNFTVAGTNVGRVAWIYYRGTFLALAITFQTVIGTMLANAAGLSVDATTNGITGGIAGLIANLTRDPFVGLAPDVINLLDCVFPLALIISQALFLATARLYMMTPLWVYQMAVRLLPG